MYSTLVLETEKADRPGRLSVRAVAILELAVLLSVMLWALWTDSKRILPPAARVVGKVTLAVVVLALLYRQKPSRSDFGLAPSHWTAGASSLALATLAAIACIFLAGASIGTIGAVADFRHWLWQNWYLEGLQQLLLQVLLAPRLRVALDGTAAITETADRRVCMLGALIFGILHLPNLPLMLLSFIAGWYWLSWFQRYRNLPAVWLSHFILGAITIYCLNGYWLRGLRVGINYLLGVP